MEDYHPPRARQYSYLESTVDDGDVDQDGDADHMLGILKILFDSQAAIAAVKKVGKTGRAKARNWKKVMKLFRIGIRHWGQTQSAWVR